MFYEEKSILIINYDRREGIIQLDRKMKNNSNAGMTLLEVIIAVSIFSISAIVLLQSFVTSRPGSIRSLIHIWKLPVQHRM